MTDQCCKTCRFWNVLSFSSETKPNDERHGAVYGGCLRYPPPLGKQKYKYSKNNHYGEWPVTFCAQWCGEWKNWQR